ncbi:MAG: response regulator transcription factor [Burkholderiales bacterium]|nr:response regulator transcription factor [Burkholderiales bacterium]MCE7875800.1 DNA-binding response regulator [Betaproteobacteria bacterium PRO3]
MPDAISVLVVDDHPIFRSGVVHGLAGEPGIAVVGAADSGEAALRMARELLPDVVLLDVSMPGWDGLATAERIATACPATAILMLTASEDQDRLLAAFKAGARGYVLKGVSVGELAQAIRGAVAGEVVVSPPLASEMLALLTRGRAPDPLQELTERERDILALIGRGLTNRAIGERLGLTEKTIKHHVTNILQKLQVRSRVEAALIAAKRLETAR